MARPTTDIEHLQQLIADLQREKAELIDRLATVIQQRECVLGELRALYERARADEQTTQLVNLLPTNIVRG